MEIELWRIVMSVVIVVAALGMGVISVLSFQCKGPILSQAWTLATPEQREKLDKKAEYHSVAVVMAGLVVAFVLLAAYLLWEQEWMFWVALLAAVIAVFLGMGGGLKRLELKFKRNK
jgi:membrane protein DedA with SNARE-associated domain